MLKCSLEGQSSFWVLDILVPFQVSDIAVKKETMKQMQEENHFLPFLMLTFSPMPLLAPHRVFATHCAQSCPGPGVRWWVVQGIGLVHDGFLLLLLLSHFFLPLLLPPHSFPTCLGSRQLCSFRGIPASLLVPSIAAVPQRCNSSYKISFWVSSCVSCTSPCPLYCHPPLSLPGTVEPGPLWLAMAQWYCGLVLTGTSMGWSPTSPTQGTLFPLLPKPWQRCLYAHLGEGKACSLKGKKASTY